MTSTVAVAVSFPWSAFGAPHEALWVLAGVGGAMLLGTTMRLLHLVVTRRGPARGDPTGEREAGRGGAPIRPRLQSLRTWWIIAASLALAVAIGPWGLTVLFAATSALAIHEFFRLNTPNRNDRAERVVVFFLLLAQYAALVAARVDLLLTLVPVGAAIAPAVLRVAGDRFHDYRAVVARTLWTAILLVYLPSFALLPLLLPEGLRPVVADFVQAPLPAQDRTQAEPQTLIPRSAGVNVCLLLILLTFGDDIAQALIGRTLKGPRLTPRLSPGKTWSGFIGGLTVSLILAAALGPWLTPLRPLQAAGGGAIIAVAGLFGDLNISGVKRDAGVKDSGSLLPGQGGVLDRIDSLTFAAPAFIAYLYLLHAAPG